jgi:hypothetical protein
MATLSHEFRTPPVAPQYQIVNSFAVRSWCRLLKHQRNFSIAPSDQGQLPFIPFGLTLLIQELFCTRMASETPDGGLHDDVKTETIRVFTSHEAADLAAANLQAHGIVCWIKADDAGGMLPNLAAPGGVRLLVQASDAVAADALLTGQLSAAETPDSWETEADVPSPALTAPRKKLAPGQIFIGIVAGVLLCLLYQWSSWLGQRTHYHYTRDGKADEAWIYRDGQLVEFERDRNLDGAWDQWTYYEHGRVVRSELDNNFDGKPDETWTYANGTLLAMEKDTDFNGTPDLFCTYEYGILQQVDCKPNGAVFATQRHLYQNGVLVEILRRGDGAGNFKEAVRYDPFFNPISTNKLQ